MTKVLERLRIVCFTRVCPQILPVCVVLWILEVSVIKKLVCFLTIISSTVERIIVEYLESHVISNFSLTHSVHEIR